MWSPEAVSTTQGREKKASVKYERRKSFLISSFATKSIK
jgi:hypothetical protein